MEGATLTWMAVVMAGLSLLDTIVGRILKYFESRDEKKYGQKLLNLEAQLATTRTELETTKLLQMRSAIDSERAKQDTAECKEQHAKTQAELAEYKTNHETNAARIDRLEAVVGSDKPTKA